MITKHFLFFLLFIFLGHQSWASVPDSTFPLRPNPPVTPVSIRSRTILVSGRLGPLRCGWAKANSSTRSWDDKWDRCEFGEIVSNKVCPPHFEPQVSVSLLEYGTCDSNLGDMYGIVIDDPNLLQLGNSYRLRWDQRDKKHLYAGYHHCDDRPVTVAYTIWCYDST